MTLRAGDGDAAGFWEVAGVALVLQLLVDSGSCMFAGCHLRISRDVTARM